MTATPAAQSVRPPRGGPWLQLVVATIGFALNFWAWALISPLGPLFSPDKTVLKPEAYEKQLSFLPFSDGQPLSASQASLMVAVPVVVGSLGRVPVGALTDRFGGRIMFPLVSAVTIVPVLVIGLWAQNSYAALLVSGIFLGIGGTSFAVGVPFVNGWFPPEKRGMATGIFGAGMGGTAISALTTVSLFKAHGKSVPFVIVAVALAVYAVIAWLLMGDAPGRVIPTTPLAQRLLANAKLPITWQSCVLYSVGFGGYVAFSVFLPLYLTNAYALTAADAANKMAGFVVIAVIMRPVGGTLADKLGSVPVLATCFTFVAICAAIASGEPPLRGYGTPVFLVMAAALGAASGATFALIAEATDPARVGGVTGLVGAAGGLGGFVPPLVMAYIYNETKSYAIGMWLLAICAALTLVLTLTVVRRTARHESSIPEEVQA
ncbi:MFS transporter [Flexivirga oryzae]|uniref:NNP family nitrate/nitrite transporter-like MFS transporter n=1 Tax=Flexivirga oryzae TaxID=1794944 RepID=A0A839NGE7_9MICO|nr:MFS transporter [Flexivirga oryzae]MBB2894666.1 NNP family nitrate/nitrite transporter-like MFS transporter [Flexivirga oryzae]